MSDEIDKYWKLNFYSGSFPTFDVPFKCNHIKQLNQFVQMINYQISRLSRLLLRQSVNLFARSKRVRDLPEVKISLPTQQQQVGQAIQPQKIDYLALRREVQELNWENMPFDELCSLPEHTLNMINMEIKKDKFNVEDHEFYAYSMNTLGVKPQHNTQAIQRLNPNYQRLCHLLLNKFQQYDQISKINQAKTGYLHEMYILDLRKNKKLTDLIEYFLNNINQPSRLDIAAEPTFIKRLLTIKRELMLQGIHFQTKKEIKRNKIAKKKQQKEQEEKNGVKEEQDEELALDQEVQDEIQQPLDGKSSSKIDAYIQQALKDSKIKVDILKVLGYQYQFWVDVKHNRSKNGVQDDYIIQERQIENPNNSMLIKQNYPKVRVKYIVHKKKRKDYAMHFTVKCNLLIRIEESVRNIKVEWRGPSSDYKQNMEDTAFLIVDYENIMNGNPTVKPVFYF